MKCPGCNRDNAFTLSICPSCGTMINDSVREELITKITPLVRPVSKPIPKPENMDISCNLTKPDSIDIPPVQETPKTIVFSKTDSDSIMKTEEKIEIPRENPETAELRIKQTSPTLVEFHNKNATLPEWRLQLKNAVRKRNDRISEQKIEDQPIKNFEVADSPRLRRSSLKTNGAAALKAEKIEETVTVNAGNPKLAAALKRIEKSRQKFLEDNQTPPSNPENAKRNNTLLYFTAKPNDHLSKMNFAGNSEAAESKSKTATSSRVDNDRFDTNKLPKLPKPATISSSFRQRPVQSEVIEQDFAQNKLEQTVVPIIEEVVEQTEIIEEETFDIQEIDDCAPFAMRFNAGLFDLIIGSFVSLLMLSPFMAMGGEWFTLSGFFAFLATTSIVMFIYMTTAIGLYGRTFGMKLFSLEVVDIEGEEYPTLHQAAVSSCVYLISLAFGGIGFLTLLFNEEKRAAHDLVSRTIVVKEF